MIIVCKGWLLYLIQALLEERKMYCFVLDHLTSVIRNEVAYNATVSTNTMNSHTYPFVVFCILKKFSLCQSHEELSTRLNELRTLTSSPNELPEESAALLIVRFSTIHHLPISNSLLLLFLLPVLLLGCTLPSSSSPPSLSLSPLPLPLLLLACPLLPLFLLFPGSPLFTCLPPLSP